MASGLTIVMSRRDTEACWWGGHSYSDITPFLRSVEQYCDFSHRYDPNDPPRTLPNGTQIPPYNGPGMSDFIRKFGRVDLLDYSVSAS
jgi:hypothetical protein